MVINNDMLCDESLIMEVIVKYDRSTVRLLEPMEALLCEKKNYNFNKGSLKFFHTD